MWRCPRCGSDRVAPSGGAGSPMRCEDCGSMVRDQDARSDPSGAETEKAPRRPAGDPRPGGLADWAMGQAGVPRAAQGSPPPEPGPRAPVSLRTDFLYFPEQATVGQALQACEEQHTPGASLLVTRVEGAYRICSLGSLLPYLTGHTPHIVHRLGECPICSGLDRHLWQDTAALLSEARADAQVRERLLSDLPLAQIPVLEARRLAEPGIAAKLAEIGFRACAVTEDGVLCGIYLVPETKTLGGLPSF